MVFLFGLVMRLYPAGFRAEFEDEMRGVFLELVAAGRSPWWELLTLLGCAIAERSRAVAPVAAGIVVAFGSQLLLYRALLGIGYALCLMVAVANAQPVPKQDPAVLAEAKAIYQRAFAAMRNAKSMDDMTRLSDALDAPEWISIDRFARQALTREEAVRSFESILSLPADHRTPPMDILWAEQDDTRMIVLAWMFAREETKDGHRLTRATLIRDIFKKTGDGWRRIQHDKLLPDGTVLAIDGKSVAEANRITSSR